MHSPSKPTRNITVYPGQAPIQSFGTDTLNMANQDRTLFRDPFNIQHWVATTGNTLIDPGTLTSPLQNERSVSDQGVSHFFSPGIQGPSLELSALSYDTDLYPVNVSPVVPSTQVFLPGNSIVNDNGSSNGIASPTEMSYTASIHALTLNDEYPSNGDVIYSPEPAPQMAWSASTDWPSPSSLTTEPSYVNCYTTPGSIPCLVNSPPVVSISEDSTSSLLGVDEYLPVAASNPCMQYPLEAFQSELIYPDLGVGDNNQSNDIMRSHDMGTSRPLTEYSYTTITDPALWLPYAQTGTNACGPNRTIQPITNANARGHPFYHIGPNPIDNLYHCPLVDCGHKPDKLKCNYDKHLDSHLKPYRCKYRSCSSIHFSSTACLLRHEREAHGMHGHGNDPFQCHYPGCDRGRGFPRRYNLEDHMRRMHKHEPSISTRRRSTTVAENPRSAIARPARRNTLDTMNELTRLERPIQSCAVSVQSALPESRTRMTSVRKRNTKVDSRRKRVK